jgi:hypothetical protein
VTGTETLAGEGFRLRRAAQRHDAWHDGVMFGLVEDDLDRET